MSCAVIAGPVFAFIHERSVHAGRGFGPHGGSAGLGPPPSEAGAGCAPLGAAMVLEAIAGFGAVPLSEVTAPSSVDIAAPDGGGEASPLEHAATPTTTKRTPIRTPTRVPTIVAR
jgi:hypothetical protein